MFAEKFGAPRIREGDALTSVAAGLGRAARAIAAGAIHLRPAVPVLPADPCAPGAA
jgi:hypothetical protein